MFVLWPLVIPAAIEAVAQAQLPHRTMDVLATITQSEASFTQPAPQGHPALPHVLCPGCGQPTDQGAHFLRQMRREAARAAGTVSRVRRPLAHEKHFCPACGAQTDHPQPSASSS